MTSMMHVLTESRHIDAGRRRVEHLKTWGPVWGLHGELRGIMDAPASEASSLLRKPIIHNGQSGPKP